MEITATDAYISAITGISAKLDVLKSYIADDHMGVSPDSVNWANVGTARHILALLEEIETMIQ